MTYMDEWEYHKMLELQIGNCIKLAENEKIIGEVFF